MLHPLAMPTLAHGDGDAAFLDAPGVGADDLFDTIRRILDGMTGDAVLTVFTDDLAVAAAAGGWCTAQGIELVALIAHDSGGATLALRRAGGR